MQYHRYFILKTYDQYDYSIGLGSLSWCSYVLLYSAGAHRCLYSVSLHLVLGTFLCDFDYVNWISVSGEFILFFA